MKDHPKKLGFCQTCGERLWEGIGHTCEPPDPRRIRNEQMHGYGERMIATLLLCDIAFSGEEEEPGRAAAAVRRLIRAMGLTDADREFAAVQSSAEAALPASWSEID